MNTKLENFFGKPGAWQPENQLLRAIILECNLQEEYKWMHPCYTFNDKNVVLIHSFKAYTALLFFSGVLMTDPHNLLVQQTENVQDRRQLRFTSLAEIEKLRPVIKSYILEAIRIAESGIKPVLKTTAEFNMPEEFELQLKRNKPLKAAFEKLTPGRQRGYLLYFSAAKQSKTRESRIEKYLPKILEGKGLED